jgi:hypothetical protein
MAEEFVFLADATDVISLAHTLARPNALKVESPFLALGRVIGTDLKGIELPCSSSRKPQISGVFPLHGDSLTFPKTRGIMVG